MRVRPVDADRDRTMLRPLSMIFVGTVVNSVLKTVVHGIVVCSGEVVVDSSTRRKSLETPTGTLPPVDQSELLVVDIIARTRSGTKGIDREAT